MAALAPPDARFPTKVVPKLGSLVHTTHEDLLVFIFEGKVVSLGGEVSDDIGHLAMPEEQDSLLLEDVNHAVYYAPVICLLVCCTCSSSSLTSSLGSTAATPPTRKSSVKDTAASAMLKGKSRWATGGLR